jgi:hypothetical protein
MLSHTVLIGLSDADSRGFGADLAAFATRLLSLYATLGTA